MKGERFLRSGNFEIVSKLPQSRPIVRRLASIPAYMDATVSVEQMDDTTLIGSMTHNSKKPMTQPINQVLEIPLVR